MMKRIAHTPVNEPGLRSVLDAQGRRPSWLAANVSPPVHPSTVTRWCQGRVPMSKERVKQIAQLLGVKPEAVR
jgi:hypothetical protein